MIFSKNELLVLKQISYGKYTTKDIVKVTGKNYQSVNLAVRKLLVKGDIFLIGKKKEKEIKVINTPHIGSLVKLLATYSNLDSILADAGIDILTNCLSNSSVEDISKRTGLSEATIYNKLKKALSMSIVKKEGTLFSVNKELWPELVYFLELVETYEKTIFLGVPAGAIVYKKRDGDLLFSFKGELDCSSKTAFSEYESYGITIHPVTNYYRLPKKNLTINEIFLDSIDIAESINSERCYLFLILFYLKNKKLIKAKNAVIQKIELVLSGVKIDNYPVLNEIKEKANVYGIKL